MTGTLTFGQNESLHLISRRAKAIAEGRGKAADHVSAILGALEDVWEDARKADLWCDGCGADSPKWHYEARRGFGLWALCKTCADRPKRVGVGDK